MIMYSHIRDGRWLGIQNRNCKVTPHFCIFQRPAKEDMGPGEGSGGGGGGRADEQKTVTNEWALLKATCGGTGVDPFPPPE